MAGATGTDLLVAGVGHVSSRVTGLDRYDTSQIVKDRFQTPEAAAPEGSDLEPSAAVV
jgi:hypothetical protein